MIEELMVAPPGYLNFRLRKSCLVQVLTSIHKEKHLFGHGLLDKAQQVSLSSWRKGAFNGNQLANGLNSEMIGPTSRRDPASFMGYVQGRCDSLIRLIQEESFNSVEAKIDPPLFNEDEWQSIQKLFATEGSVFEPALDIRDQAPASSRTLVVRLDGLPVELKQAVLNNDPSRLIRYAFEVASDLEEFRQSVRFYTEEKALLTAKLGVLTAGQQVLSNCLKLVGAANPE